MSIFLIGALGLAVDGGHIFAQRQMAQAAADAATQAGIESILNGTNATSAHKFGTTSATYVCTTTDLITPCAYARFNGFGGTTGDTVTLSYPSTVSGVTASSTTIPFLTVTVQRTIQTSFIRMLGAAATTTVSAKGTTALIDAAAKYCLIALSSSAQYSFSVNSSTVTASSCGIAVNSSYATSPNNGLQVENGSTISASVINVFAAPYISGSTVTPTPTVTGTVVADPLISLPAPAVGTCTAHPYQTSPAAGATLTPGTYCGGIYVGNSANNVTFSPGIYILNGGGLSLNRPGLTATGVMFYFTGTSSNYGSLYVGNTFTGTLSAPTSGTYQGILCFGDRSIVSVYSPSNGAQISNGVSVSLSGTLYFPTTNVAFTSGASNPAYMAIVANSIALSSGASISAKSDPTGYYTGLSSQSVSLVR